MIIIINNHHHHHQHERLRWGYNQTDRKARMKEKKWILFSTCKMLIINNEMVTIALTNI